MLTFLQSLITIMKTLADNFEIKSFLGLGTKLVMSKELTPIEEEVI